MKRRRAVIPWIPGPQSDSAQREPGVAWGFPRPRGVSAGSSVLTNVPVWWGAALGGGGERVVAGAVWEISVPSTQLCCELKTSLKPLLSKMPEGNKQANKRESLPQPLTSNDLPETHPVPRAPKEVCEAGRHALSAGSLRAQGPRPHPWWGRAGLASITGHSQERAPPPPVRWCLWIRRRPEMRKR